MRLSTLSRPTAAVAVTLLTAATLAACGSSEAPPTEDPAEASNAATAECEDLVDAAADAPASGADTFVFAASSDPATLNPFFASDGETFRVSRQMFEGLVGAKPCSPDPAPLLATEWETAPDGQSTTFQLRDDVTFQDGTPFNAEAVCSNFEYWANQPKGPSQSPNNSYYWISLFKGFGADSIFDSCETDGDTTATINLTEPYAGFVAAMSLPAFSMQSPTALAADGTVADGGNPLTTKYASGAPVGTGPYSFDSWNRGQEVRLVANEDYWGDKAKTPNVVIRTISDPGARRDALLAGEIDGYDLVAPGDLAAIEDGGGVLVNRPPFNVLYLGFNQQNPALAKPEVREALAHAIDEEAVAAETLPPGSEVATQFVPSNVAGYSDDVTEYEYDPELAMQMLANAGESDLSLDFNYPTDVSRPYMPSPVDTMNVIRRQLEAVGITVTPVGDQWDPDYLDKIQSTPDHDIHLLGWTGDYNDTDNFLGVFFGAETDEWGFDNPDLFSALKEARGLPTVDEQVPAYEKINDTVMDFLPGIPIASPVPTLAFGDNVAGFVPSPVQDEPFTSVVVSE